MKYFLAFSDVWLDKPCTGEGTTCSSDVSDAKCYKGECKCDLGYYYTVCDQRCKTSNNKKLKQKKGGVTYNGTTIKTMDA